MSLRHCVCHFFCSSSFFDVCSIFFVSLPLFVGSGNFLLLFGIIFFFSFFRVKGVQSYRIFIILQSINCCGLTADPNGAHKHSNRNIHTFYSDINRFHPFVQREQQQTPTTYLYIILEKLSSHVLQWMLNSVTMLVWKAFSEISFSHLFETRSRKFSRIVQIGTMHPHHTYQTFSHLCACVWNVIICFCACQISRSFPPIDAFMLITLA